MSLTRAGGLIPQSERSASGKLAATTRPRACGDASRLSIWEFSTTNAPTASANWRAARPATRTSAASNTTWSTTGPRVRCAAGPRPINLAVTGGESAKGYYLLAYHPRNYLASCKTCNSTLKSNCFPIAGRRNTRGGDPVRLASEKPLLPYPLGHVDDDPETIISFEGVSPVAVANRGHRRHRAEVTVAFFKLDVREELLRGRAGVISFMVLALRLSDSQLPADRLLAEQSVNILIANNSPHAACARSFRRLYRSRPVRAMDLARLALTYLNSES